jgi:DNA-binding CsgD family transcriptional regulator
MWQRAAFAVIGVATAGANWLIGEPWWAALIMGIGVVTFGELASRALEIKLRPHSQPIPPLRLHGRNNDIAMHVADQMTNHEIATRMSMSETEVSRRVDNICRTLRLTSRSELIRWARENLRHPDADQPTHAQRHRERWEWVAEVGTGIAIMALGLGALALPPNTRYVGTPSWIGLSLVAFGLAVCLLSTSTYAWELTRGRHYKDTGITTRSK